ncbi:hypothetical protein OIU84_009494 [Salix udensis]|uniref:Uncharacterized protein n=1 Tax=Salix udensis TaxID=889485 RepID=A0AAD6NYS0_9ROSI|nr:hypothetical protein OIU84_009494 [Salix udensis]
MKSSAPPLFSILLLIIFSLTLSSKILVRRGGGFSSIEVEEPSLVLREKVPVFNSTLLKYAAIDVGEAQAKHEIEELLKGRFGSRGRIVKYYSLKRFVEETRKPLDEWCSVHDGSMFHYSSGLQAVMLAVGICDKVSIFGFGKSASARHHYHTNQKAELKLHDYEAEYDLYHDLVNNPQAIPFITGTFKFPTAMVYQ